MLSYKVFEQGMIYNGKKYAENTTVKASPNEELRNTLFFTRVSFQGAECCPLLYGGGELTELAHAEILGDQLKIGTKFTFHDLVKEVIDSDMPKDKLEAQGHPGECIVSNSDCARIVSNGDHAEVSVGGIGAQVISNGNCASIDLSGRYAVISSNGRDAHITSHDRYGCIVSSGSYAGISTNGAQSVVCSSGCISQITCNGYETQIASSGDDTKISSAGNCTLINTSGKRATVSSSGRGTLIKSTGKHSVICCTGEGCRVSAKIGSWITLTEWKLEDHECRPACKTEYVDGERIKEDTLYEIKNGEFVEVQNLYIY